MTDDGNREAKQRSQRLRGNWHFPDFQFDDPQLQEVLQAFRNALIEQEGYANAATRGHDLAVNANQRVVRVQDLVDAGLCSVVNGKLVRANSSLSSPETS